MNENKHMTDAELDALFKNADQASSIPAFDEAFWNEMEAVLPQKKRRGFIFWWITGGSVAAIAILFMILGIDGDSTKRQLTGTNTFEQKRIVNDKNQLNTKPSTENESTTLENNATPSFQHFDNIAATQENGDPIKIEIIEPKAQNDVQEVNGNEAMDFSAMSKRGWRFTEPFVLNDVEQNRGLANKLPFYTEFSVGFGQSYKRIDFENNWATQFRLGAGFTTDVPGLQLGFGAALRAELPNNIQYTSSTNAAGSNNKTVYQYRGLYSLEFPIEATSRLGRSQLGITFVPGLQLGFTGNKSYFVNEQLVQRSKTNGKVEDAKSLTMEGGIKYMYSLSEQLQLTGSCTVDFVRPFQSAYYQGENQAYPVTFFVGLRRKF